MIRKGKQVVFPGIYGLSQACQGLLLLVICSIAALGCSRNADDRGTWTVSVSSPPGIEIVAPASAPMEFAASELARYLSQILGKPLSVKPTAAGEPRIVIQKVVDKDMDDEWYEILAEGNTLRIRGGGDLGIVYGVYEFLRRYGGCRFSGLGPDGEPAGQGDATWG